MSKNTKKQTTKYVSRWFSNASLDGDFSSISKPFLTREEAYDYTKRVLDDPKNTSMPFAVIWEQKYPLLNLADGVGYGTALVMLREIKGKLDDQLEGYSDARFRRCQYESCSFNEHIFDLSERIKKTIAAWQEENNIIAPADNPVGWCKDAVVAIVKSNWSDRQWDDGDKAGIAEEIKL